MTVTNKERMRLLASRIAEQVSRGTAKGLDAARVFITGRVKESLSVPAPRKPVRAKPGPGQKKGGILYYRATTPATSGAPPRKLSGRLRSSVWSKMTSPNKAVIGANARGMPTKRMPMGFNYPRYHEVKTPGQPGSGQHQFVVPTVKKWKSQIKRILGRNIVLR